MHCVAILDDSAVSAMWPWGFAGEKGDDMLWLMLFMFAATTGPLDEAPPPRTHTLPAEWHGVWSGSLERVGDDPLTTMHLEIAPLEDRPGVTWRLTYGDGRNADVRDYELIPGVAADRYYIDEKNGIQLDARLAGDTLHCAFAMRETLAFSSYVLTDETITFEIAIFSTAATAESSVGEGENELVVTNYQPLALQRATLRRVMNTNDEPQ